LGCPAKRCRANNRARTFALRAEVIFLKFLLLHGQEGLALLVGLWRTPNSVVDIAVFAGETTDTAGTDDRLRMRFLRANVADSSTVVNIDKDVDASLRNMVEEEAGIAVWLTLTGMATRVAIRKGAFEASVTNLAAVKNVVCRRDTGPFLA